LNFIEFELDHKALPAGAR